MFADGCGIWACALAIDVLFGVTQQLFHLLERELSSLEFSDCSRVINEPPQNFINVFGISAWEAYEYGKRIELAALDFAKDISVGDASAQDLTVPEVFFAATNTTVIAATEDEFPRPLRKCGARLNGIARSLGTSRTVCVEGTRPVLGGKQFFYGTASTRGWIPSRSALSPASAGSPTTTVASFLTELGEDDVVAPCDVSLGSASGSAVSRITRSAAIFL
nr:hypothetical protein [Corynebacterium lactis]